VIQSSRSDRGSVSRKGAWNKSCQSRVYLPEATQAFREKNMSNAHVVGDRDMWMINVKKANPIGARAATRRSPSPWAPCRGWVCGASAPTSAKWMVTAASDANGPTIGLIVCAGRYHSLTNPCTGAGAANNCQGAPCANRAGINPAPLRSSTGKPTKLRRRLGRVRITMAGSAGAKSWNFDS
jgi:hypothetical protein